MVTELPGATLKPAEELGLWARHQERAQSELEVLFGVFFDSMDSTFTVPTEHGEVFQAFAH